MLLPNLTLAVAALVALGIGAGLVLAPRAMLAKAGVTQPPDVSLANDYRGLGGAFLAAGLFFATGLLLPAFLLPALVAATLVYAGFGLGRGWALLADGMPVQSFVIAMAVEFSISVLCLVCVLRLITAPI